MPNILIFRTDRVGDFLITCPVILTIKKYFNNPKITLVCSDKNNNYAKEFAFINETLIYPSKNSFSKINFILNLSKRKFDYVFIFDGKNRSIIASLFIFSKYKTGLVNNHFLRIFLKLINFKLIYANNSINLIESFQKMLTLCKINSKIKYFNFLTNNIDNKFSNQISKKKYVQIHLDEKWNSNLYIKRYKDISPSYDNFINFISNLAFNNDVLITTGLIDFLLVESLKKKFFKKISNKIYFKKINNNNVHLIDKPSLKDLESLTKNAKLFISCHCSITHMANSFNIKIFDIIDESRVEWYKRFNSYLSNYNFILRKDFNLLKVDLIKKVDDFL